MPNVESIVRYCIHYYCRYFFFSMIWPRWSVGKFFHSYLQQSIEQSISVNPRLFTRFNKVYVFSLFRSCRYFSLKNSTTHILNYLRLSSAVDGIILPYSSIQSANVPYKNIRISAAHFWEVFSPSFPVASTRYRKDIYIYGFKLIANVYVQATL